MPADADHRRHWEDLATLDPHWAVLSDPERKHGRWDDTAFLATGEREVAGRLERAERLGLLERRRAALDFGCGLGRTARALARRYERCVGVDISPTMVERGRELNAGIANLQLRLNEGDDLTQFRDGEFDLVYSSIVLQHLPGRQAVLGAIAELARVTARDGALVFQLPSRLSAGVRLQPRRTLYRTLSRAGLSPATLYRRLGLHPMTMLAVPREDVERVLAGSDKRLVDADVTTDPQFGFESTVYYAA